jgi:hypothetical protein
MSGFYFSVFICQCVDLTFQLLDLGNICSNFHFLSLEHVVDLLLTHLFLPLYVTQIVVKSLDYLILLKVYFL